MHASTILSIVGIVAAFGFANAAPIAAPGNGVGFGCNGPRYYQAQPCYQQRPCYRNRDQYNDPCRGEFGNQFCCDNEQYRPCFQGCRDGCRDNCCYRNYRPCNYGCREHNECFDCFGDNDCNFCCENFSKRVADVLVTDDLVAESAESSD
ncbi:hypothetical protein BZA05DRAFT_449477 [Tricharina praecox]|uniref:uncharacterized protein n=1 Tax=Tricharina praecox TaxID=43433 RepID=UPI0022211B07|nr:uncharacterized protein BZA05DRAFT_449477 [Tricharina praecox]KAI5841660.1 hypothetical protein BZA05DRAFT_449477 [Tricharina praecox]